MKTIYSLWFPSLRFLRKTLRNLVCSSVCWSSPERRVSFFHLHFHPLLVVVVCSWFGKLGVFFLDILRYWMPEVIKQKIGFTLIGIFSLKSKVWWALPWHVRWTILFLALPRCLAEAILLSGIISKHSIFLSYSISIFFEALVVVFDWTESLVLSSDWSSDQMGQRIPQFDPVAFERANSAVSVA